jgi:hypothetical protein
MSYALDQKGAITDTMRKARAWKDPYSRPDPRKVAQRMRMQADGLERQAGFARDEGNMRKSRECLAHAARLRIEAQSAVG